MESPDNLLAHRTVEIEGKQPYLTLVQLPEVDGRRPCEWVFARSLEHFLWGPSSSSNLNHSLREMRLDTARRNITRANCGEFGLTEEHWRSLSALFLDWSLEVDGLTSAKWRQIVLLPLVTAAQVARQRAELDLEAIEVLRALGQPVPEHLATELARMHHDAADEVNLSLPDPGEEDPGADELVAMALGQELLLPADPVVMPEEEEEPPGRRYAWETPSQTLSAQMDAFRAYRRRALVANRSAKAVVDATVDSDIGVLKRFLGYVSLEHPGPLSMDLGLFRAEHIQEMLQGFAEWLVDARRCSMGTIAGYMNSLLTLANFAVGEVHQEPNEALDEVVTTSLWNLRGQAEAKAKDDARYRPRDPNFISWADAHRTRMRCQAAFEALPLSDREARLRVGEQLAILTLLTYQPPGEADPHPGIGGGAASLELTPSLMH